MALCSCPERPRCESQACDFHADWTVWQPQWGSRPESFVFMCDWHYQQLKDFMTKPVRGLDPMDPNDEYFRPSIEEMIKHAAIAIAFEERKKKSHLHMPDWRRQPWRKDDRGSWNRKRKR